MVLMVFDDFLMDCGWSMMTFYSISCFDGLWGHLITFNGIQYGFSRRVFSAYFLPASSRHIFLQKRPASKIVNSLARIKFNSSKWLWEESLLVSAIILDSSLMKNESYIKASNEGRPPKLSIFELELSSIAQNDQEKNRD